MTTLAGTPVAIILAAGKSERLGTDKLFATIGGQAVIERVVHAFLQAQKVGEIVVVIPPGRKEDFSWLQSVRVHLVENPDPEKGMISSLRTALRSSWAEGRDFLVAPGDVPFLSTEIVDRIVQTFMGRPCRIVIPTFQGLGGHPGMYAASLLDDFFLRGDTNGAREILIRHKDETVRLSVHDPDVCFDIDTPEDLRIAEDPGARWARVERDIEEKKKGRYRGA
jgi:molybdenum cofactor cytidylyltransferase